MYHRSLTLALAILIGSSFAISACYKGRPPGEAIAAAEYALRKAQEDGADQHAAVVLRKAQDKVKAAKIAEEEGANEDAVRKAEEATLEAQLADEMARNARTRLLEKEAERGLAILRVELERAGR